MIVQGDNEKQQQWADHLLSTAWFVANLSRAKRLPPLRHLLNSETEPPTEEEIDEYRTMFAELVEALEDGS